MRKKLECGQTVTLSAGGSVRALIIDSLIGDGASCLAYEAHAAGIGGSAARYRLKECYPHDAHVERKGTMLVWHSAEDQKQAFDRFRRAVQVLSELHNEETVGNNVTGAELYEGNGTLYAIMQINHACVYAKCGTQDLHTILDTIHVLTIIVAHLHDLGWLHLDIKPENFLASFDPSISIWLFDVDSLTSMQDLMNGVTVNVPYSQTWAAPEQVAGHIAEIGTWTDLYSIGAVLFAKIMGRPANSSDCGRFASWKFDSELFEDVNPKIKCQLSEIFHKTLAASPKRRWQTAGELAAALKEATHTVDEGVPFLLSDCPTPSSFFVGRQKEVADIGKAFHTGKHIVFLHGIGGIGKSETAKNYAQSASSEYDAVIFLRYHGSLQEIMESIEIQHFSGTEQEHKRTLRRLLDSHVLIIVDNFDTAPEDDLYLPEIARLPARFLFTSRTDFSSTIIENAAHIEISGLPERDLERIFLWHSKCGALNSKDAALLHIVLARVEGHTYMTELLARQMRYSGWVMTDVHAHVIDGLSAFVGREKIPSVKDERIMRMPLTDIMRAVFRIGRLNETQKQVLRNLTLLSFVRMNRDAYKELSFWCSQKERSLRYTQEMDALNELLELGWVRNERSLSTISGGMDDFYSLHPLVYEMVKLEMPPTEENCIGVYSNVLYRVPYDWGDPDEIHDAKEAAEEENALKFIIQFLCNVDLENDDNLNLLISVFDNVKQDYQLDADKWSIDYLQESVCNIPSAFTAVFHDLYEKMDSVLTSGEIDMTRKAQVAFYLENAWLNRLSERLLGLTEEARVQNDKEYSIAQHKASDYTLLAIDLAENLTGDIRDSILLKALQSAYYHLHGHVADEEDKHLPDCKREIVARIVKLAPQILSIKDKNALGLSLTETEQEILCKELEQEQIYADISKRTDSQSDLLAAISGELYSAEEIYPVLQKYLDDNSLTYRQRLDLLDTFAAKVYGYYEIYYHGYNRTFPERNWIDIRSSVEYADNFLSRNEDAVRNEECTDSDWQNYSTLLALCHAVVAIHFGEQDAYNKAADCLIKDSEERYEYFSSSWPSFSSSYAAISYITLQSVSRSLRHPHWVLQPVIHMYERLYAEYSEDNPEDRLYSLVEDIYYIASESADVVGNEDPMYLYYIECKKKYRAILDQFIGKTFHYKDEEPD